MIDPKKPRALKGQYEEVVVTLGNGISNRYFERF